MTENMQADSVQSRQAGFVRCCLKLTKDNLFQNDRPDEMPDDGKEYEVTWDKEIGTVSEDTTYKAVIKEVTSDSASETEDVTDNTEVSGETSDETASAEVSNNE